MSERDEPRESSRGRFPPARKSLGQHFLADRRILTRIADAIAPAPGETIIEIGPGRGALTDILAERASRLIAVEYDRALASMLRERYARRANVIIAEADVLSVSLGELAQGPYALVGNVPYYITTPILFHALERPRADRAVYLVQREVADRLSAAPGSREYGALTVNVAAVAKAQTLFKVPAGAFSPPPKIESAVVRITPLAEPLISAEEERPFKTLVQSAFSMRRKQVQRILRSTHNLNPESVDSLLAELGINPAARPETLSPQIFATLLRRLAA